MLGLTRRSILYQLLSRSARQAIDVNEARKVNANANTIAQNAIAKAMKSAKTEVAGEVAFA